MIYLFIWKKYRGWVQGSKSLHHYLPLSQAHKQGTGLEVEQPGPQHGAHIYAMPVFQAAA